MAQKGEASPCDGAFLLIAGQIENVQEVFRISPTMQCSPVTSGTKKKKKRQAPFSSSSLWFNVLLSVRVQPRRPLSASLSVFACRLLFSLVSFRNSSGEETNLCILVSRIRPMYRLVSFESTLQAVQCTRMHKHGDYRKTSHG